MASVERTARMLSPSPLMFSRCAYAMSLMCLCSTRVAAWRVGPEGSDPRRLSCTSRCCNRLHRAPRVGARRIRCRCWQPLPSGCQRSHPVWQDFYNSSERRPLCDIHILSRSCWRARLDGAHEQVCVRRARSCLWHARQRWRAGSARVSMHVSPVSRARVWWARACWKEPTALFPTV